MSYTDRYLKRSFRLIKHSLNPSSVYFLGDHFDGGREWSTLAPGFKPTEEWTAYDHGYWLKEYARFADIFFSSDTSSGRDDDARLIFTSVPGNHDIGFGKGVQDVVRRRFQTFFGDPNRIDVIGNHTFVGLDTVSLSAMDISDASHAISQPTRDFLDTAKAAIHDRTRRELDLQSHMESLPVSKDEHTVTFKITTSRRRSSKPNELATPGDLPTVVLSHVPFYRPPGTPCGPLRERYPPSAAGLTTDDRNAIRVAGGYQYQNVLSRQVSTLIANSIANIGHVFSGDDHDYCEIVHKDYASAGSGIREVTVKSLSWAMGVRKPGFLLVSLWNPIDGSGQPMPNSPLMTKQPTLQHQQCLLPDQLGTFIGYAWMLAFTVFGLSLHAVLQSLRDKRSIRSPASSSILPLVDTKRAVAGDLREESYMTSSSPTTGVVRARSASQASLYSGVKKPSTFKVANWTTSMYNSDKKYDDVANDAYKSTRHRQRMSALQLAMLKFKDDMLVVAGVVFAFYFWLIYNG